MFVQPVADARRDLWQFYATGGFLRRNKVFAQELTTLAAEGVPLRRVFEFAADGSFMAVRALATWSRSRSPKAQPCTT
mgnify:CR=1 FL=1